MPIQLKIGQGQKYSTRCLFAALQLGTLTVFYKKINVQYPRITHDDRL